MKVSVVLPFYNAQNTLERAISSLLNQKEVDQIILVNDGSTDESLSICQKFIPNYPHIQLISDSKKSKMGAPFCRNLGLSHVRNAWVQFMDADDELLPGKINDQLICIHGNEALVVGKFTFFEKGHQEDKIPLQNIWSGLITNRLGLTSSNLWNVDWVRKAGGWDESLPNLQEYYLMFEILKRNGKVVFSDGIFTHIHSQTNSITNSLENQRIKRNNYFVFRQKVKNHLISIGKYKFRKMHYYEICTGKMLEYHQPPFEVELNKIYYSLYSLVKKMIK